MAEVRHTGTIYGARVHLRRRVRPLVLLGPLLLGPLLWVSCTSEGAEPLSETDRDEMTAMCDQIQAIQQQVVDAGNAMSSAEVAASPEERAVILADGLVAMIDAVQAAGLPTEPAALVDGLAIRRDRVVADADDDVANFRATWSSVSVDERRSAVQRVFVIGEKLMSEVEPRVRDSTPPELIELARDTPSCRHVIQLPRPKE